MSITVTTQPPLPQSRTWAQVVPGKGAIRSSGQELFKINDSTGFDPATGSVVSIADSSEPVHQATVSGTLTFAAD